jgi:hypothetical protein
LLRADGRGTALEQVAHNARQAHHQGSKDYTCSPAAKYCQFNRCITMTLKTSFKSIFICSFSFTVHFYPFSSLCWPS